MHDVRNIRISPCRAGSFAFLVFLLAILFNNCAAVSPGAPEVKRIASYAVSPNLSTKLSRALKTEVAAHPGESGFKLVTTGSDAFYTRIALVQAAEKSLDLQYYIVEDDLTGQTLLEEILRAAERGVRVRILLDTLPLRKVDDIMTVMNVHPNVEIRGFNPPVTRTEPFWTWFTNWVTDFERISRRMHNKVLIADNQAAILGGRNLGDEYFDTNADFNFNDLDVAAFGPIVPKISDSFDVYWNSNPAYPLSVLNVPTPTPELTLKVRQELKKHWEEVTETPRGNPVRYPTLLQRLATGQHGLRWAKAELLVDSPDKVEQSPEQVRSPLMRRLDQFTDRAESEFIAVTPYFVPRDEGVEWLAAMVERGLKVRILTNSLASTDVPAVHTGYARYRRQMMASGVELYEFKPIPGKRSRQNLSAGSSRASLHSKVYVVDRVRLMVASFNLDPRSIELNTEIALAIYSPALSAQVLAMFNESISPANSYRVTFTDGPEPRLAWVTEEKGQKTIYHHEPKPGVWRRLVAGIFTFLPVESQL